MATEKPKTGRPTKLTPDVQAKIIQAIAAGNYIETAAAYAGIHKSVLYDWLKRGAQCASGIHHDFSVAVEKALADAEVRDVAIVGRAAQGDWRAAAWRLERKFPDRWGVKERHEVTGKDGGPIQTEDTTLVAKLEALARVQAPERTA